MLFGAYIRVSRIGERAETLISPKLQERQIRSWAKIHGHELVVLPPELDASGGDDTRPVLLAAIEQIERAELDGIVVWKADRFTRSLQSSLRMLERVEGAGGLFRSATEQIDPTAPEGRMFRNMLFSMAQMEREQKAEGFDRAKADAIARGVYIAGRVPLGYRRGGDRRLVVDPDIAPLVRQCFERRARGASWRELADFLATRLGRPFYGPAVSSMLRNPAYLGEARQGRHRNAAAHEAIVSRELFDRAQVPNPRPPRGTGGPALLAGLIRCAGCSRRMSPTMAEGKREYRCNPRSAGGVCGAPANIAGGRIERHVESVVLSHLSTLRAAARKRTNAVDAAQVAVDEAEAELRAFQQAVDAIEEGVEQLTAGLRSRLERVDQARRELAEARLSATPMPEPSTLLERWETMDVAARRHVLRGSLSVVWVWRGRAAVRDRVRLVAAGHAPTGLSVQGRVAVPRSVEWTEADLPGEIRALGA